MHRAQGNGDDFGRENEVGANRALDLVFLQGHQVYRRVLQRLQQLGLMGRVVFCAVQKLVGQLLKAFKTQKGTANHQQRRDQPRRHDADSQGRGHQDHLVQQRAFAHGPHHRQLALGRHAGNLLRIQGEVVPQNTGGFLGRHFAEYGHIVEDGGNVVQKGKKAAGHTVVTWSG